MVVFCYRRLQRFHGSSHVPQDHQQSCKIQKPEAQAAYKKLQRDSSTAASSIIYFKLGCALCAAVNQTKTTISITSTTLSYALYAAIVNPQSMSTLALTDAVVILLTVALQSKFDC